MRKLFFLFVLCCTAHLASAQLLSAGFKAGANLGSARLSDARSDWENEGMTVGVHAGFYSRLNLGPLFVQPEAYYTFTQARLSKEQLQFGTEELQLDFHRLDVPVLAGFYMGRIFRVNAGPFASLLLNTRGESDRHQNLEDRAQDYYERSSWGWQAGIGLDLGPVTLDTRYETTVGNLRDFQPEDATLSDYLPQDQKHQQVIMSLGFKF